jgi:hypothetical protein
MKREDFKISIETRDELVTKDEKSVSVSITTNGGRQWITLPALTKDEVMLLHDELEKFFLEGISVQTLEKRLSEMSEGEVFGIKVIDENGKQVWWRVKKLVVFRQEPTYFVGVIGNNDTIGSFGSKNDMEKLANDIIDYICEVSMNFCYGKKFRFKFSD